MADTSSINVAIHVAAERHFSDWITMSMCLLVGLYIGNHAREYLTACSTLVEYIMSLQEATRTGGSQFEDSTPCSAQSTTPQPVHAENDDLESVTTAAEIHETTIEPTDKDLDASGDVTLVPLLSAGRDAKSKELEGPAEGDSKGFLNPRPLLVDTNTFLDQTVCGTMVVFDSTPLPSDPKFVGQVASFQTGKLSPPAIITLSSTIVTIETSPLNPTVHCPPYPLPPLFTPLDQDGWCGCAEPTTRRREHVLIQSLKDSILAKTREVNLKRDIMKLPKDHAELFEGSTARIFVALRLAVTNQCTSFVQWYQSTINYWPAKIREDIMISICDNRNREIFQSIAHDWLGSGEVKVRVLERLAYNGDLELINYMLDRYKSHGTSWYSFPNHSNALDLALIAACARGHVAVAKRLIALGANVKGPNLAKSMLAQLLHTPSQTFHETPLIAAAGLQPENCDEIIKILISAGASDGGPRAMHKALKERSAEMIWRLMKHNISPSVYGGKREWALAISVVTGHSQLTEAMLCKDIDINRAPAIWACRTVLQCVAARGANDSVKKFLDHGADINNRGHALDWGGNCAVIAAASCGHADTVRLLLERGADIKSARSYFGDFLQTICYLGHASVLEVVLHMQPPGLDWNVQTRDGADLPALAARALIIPDKRTLGLADNAKVVRLLTTKVPLFRKRCASRIEDSIRRKPVGVSSQLPATFPSKIISSSVS